MEQQVLEGEKYRKKLLNTILELKGNIRVFCRVRPPTLSDVENVVISYPTDLESLGRRINLMHNGTPHSFTFDKTFGEEVSQENVFLEISELVQSTLDGHNVCIFAYGQTGSGKTYTMMGNSDILEERGLIPRSLEQIFETNHSLQSQGWKSTMQVSVLEIYNETIRDLLAKTRGSTKQHLIKHDANGNIYVTNLTKVDACSISDALNLLKEATRRRSVGSTIMNDKSSRSRLVFTLQVTVVNEGLNQHNYGELHFVDLAGCKRLPKSGGTSSQQEETKNINSSLLALEMVFLAIEKKNEYIPFRGSKLTELLQVFKYSFS